MATWYPQMGGYCGKCIVVPIGDCFDAYVWHDGDFPFSGDAPPTFLHHCDPQQFIRFGTGVAQFLGAQPPPSE